MSKQSSFKQAVQECRRFIFSGIRTVFFVLQHHTTRFSDGSDFCKKQRGLLLSSCNCESYLRLKAVYQIIVLTLTLLPNSLLQPPEILLNGLGSSYLYIYWL